MPDEFHNPYHFVPVKPERSHDDISREEFKKKSRVHLTHECYVNKTNFNNEDTYSGRIICRMITEDPIFIGDKKSELPDGSHRVLPFEMNDKPAIPASTIRGMISAVTEAASNSALRVLEKRYYSYRVEMRDALGALGMIVKEKLANGETGYKLRPLSLPSLRWKKNMASIPEIYSQMFTKPLLKVYINGYQKQGQNITKTAKSFLSRKSPVSYSADKQEFWYIKLAGECLLKGNSVECTTPYIKLITNRQGDKISYLNGQRALSDPITEEEYRNLPEKEKKEYTRGILRVLGIDGREDKMPTTKKHEIFIPYPPEMETYPVFDAEEAVNSFHNLAKERTRADKCLPFELKGSKRNEKATLDDANIKFRNGDIVFFRISNTDNSKVEEVSISSIWRKSTEGCSYDYFKEVSPEILPFNPERSTITIAEQMFGFVEHEQNDRGNLPHSEKNNPLSIASRLRFSFGILKDKEDEPYYLPEVLLKILDSPKPPCPSLYFKKKNNNDGNFIAKKSLSIHSCIPQGRKFYLHRSPKNPEPWRTNHEDDNLKQKNRIKPFKKDLPFYFHVDFNNLSRTELSLLCYAIKPIDTYRHKIGMGKSIGLGKVQIIPEGLFIIDRTKRYFEKDIFLSNRYHRAWVKNGSSANWPAGVYSMERGVLITDNMDSPEFLRKEFADRMDRDIQNAIELLGNPEKVEHPVHTPQLRNLDIEKETFKWFVENVKTKKQGLEPIDKNSTSLPHLNRRF